MLFLALIAGLILVIAGGSWFAAATTVGWILVAVAVTAFLLQVGLFAAVALLGNKQVSSRPRSRF